MTGNFYFFQEFEDGSWDDAGGADDGKLWQVKGSYVLNQCDPNQGQLYSYSGRLGRQ